MQLEFNDIHVISRVFPRGFTEWLQGFAFYRMLPGGLAPLGAYRAIEWALFGDQNIVAIRPGSPLDA